MYWWRHRDIMTSTRRPNDSSGIVPALTIICYGFPDFRLVLWSRFFLSFDCSNPFDHVHNQLRDIAHYVCYHSGWSLSDADDLFVRWIHSQNKQCILIGGSGTLDVVINSRDLLLEKADHAILSGFDELIMDWFLTDQTAAHTLLSRVFHYSGRCRIPSMARHRNVKDDLETNCRLGRVYRPINTVSAMYDTHVFDGSDVCGSFSWSPTQDMTRDMKFYRYPGVISRWLRKQGWELVRIRMPVHFNPFMIWLLRAIQIPLIWEGTTIKEVRLLHPIVIISSSISRQRTC